MLYNFPRKSSAFTNSKPYLDLVELNAFAVQFRYEAFDMEDEQIDRPAILIHIGELTKDVEQLINR